jgi:hypothetical protein
VRARAVGLALLLLGLALLLVGVGCAPIAWAPPPGAPPEALGIDDAGCQLTARGMQPIDGWHGLVGVALSASEQRQDYVLCMRAHGYVPVAGGPS